MKARWVRALKIGAIGITAVVVFGFVVMSLWNWLAPEVFGARTIGFWQALGILVLSKILFGGFHGRPGHGKPQPQAGNRVELGEGADDDDVGGRPHPPGTTGTM